MSITSTRITTKLTVENLRELLGKNGCNVVIGPHALQRLSQSQRKVFNQNELITPLLKDSPSIAGQQENGNYALYFRRKEGFLKIILAEKKDRLEIVTFMHTQSTPIIRETDNGP